MKKLFLFLILGMFLINFTSAFEFDNVKEYDAVKREVTVYNSILGMKTSEVGKAVLNTPLNMKVPAGEDVLVAEFSLSSKEDYSNALKELEFTDLKKKTKITREYVLKYKTIEEVKVIDYETICTNETKPAEDIKAKAEKEEKPENKTNSTITVCVQKEKGSHVEKKVTWTPLNSKNVQKDSFQTIGIFTDVQVEDYVDWVPEMFGIKVQEWATWTADLNVDIAHYYKLDESSGAVIDSIQNTNGANNGATAGVTGKINTAYDFVRADGDYIDTGFQNCQLGQTITAWVYSEDTGEAWIVSEDSGGFDYAFLQYDGHYRIHVGNDGFNSAQTIVTNEWVFFTYTINSSGGSLYMNGNPIILDQGNPGACSTTQNYRLTDTSNSWVLNGKIDEVGFWNRTLSPTEINQIYNAGAGLPFNVSETIPIPYIVLNSPESANYTTLQNVIVNFTVSDAINLTDVKLYVNSVLNQTNASGINNTNYIFDLGTLGDGNYTIYGIATNNNSETNQSSSIQINIDTTPYIAFVTPPTPANNSLISTTYIPFKVNLEMKGYSGNLTLGVFNTNETDSSQSYVMSPSSGAIRNITVPDGDYRINATICVTTGQCNSTETRQVSVDTTMPEIEIFSPTGTLPYLIEGQSMNLSWNVTDANLDSCSFRYPAPDETYTVNGLWNDGNLSTYMSSTFSGQMRFMRESGVNNITLSLFNDTLGETVNFTYDLPPTCSLPYMQYITVTYDNSFGTTWLQCFNGSANTYIATFDGTLPRNYVAELFYNNYPSVYTELNCSDNSTTFNYIYPYNNLTFYANDTLGNSNSVTTSWATNITSYELTYDSVVSEGEQNNFSAVITLNDSASIESAYLNYNGTNYSSQIYYSAGEYIIYNSVNAPLVNSSTQVSLYYSITSGGINYIFPTVNQTVSNVNFTLCGGGSDDVLLNMSLVDENNITSPIMGDIQIASNLISKSSGELIESINDEFTGVSSGAICLSPSTDYALYYLDAEIRYTSTGFASEWYIMQKADLEDAPMNLTLYDLNLNSSTEFKITYQDSSFNFVENAVVQLQRKYISDGLFWTVEAPSTSQDGTTVLHIDLNSVKYRATVVKDGIVLDEFDNLVFKCESELTGVCEQKLLGSINPQNDQNYDNIIDFYYSDPVLTNNTITVSFSVPSGSPSSVNIILTQKDSWGNKTICNRTVISSAGSISCDYSETLGDSYIDFSITKDGEPISISSYIVDADKSLDWLGNNYVFIFILLLSLVGMALSSPEWMVINGIVTMVISGALYLASGLNFVMGLGSIAWLVIAGIILIAKMSKQEDR